MSILTIIGLILSLVGFMGIIIFLDKDRIKILICILMLVCGIILTSLVSPTAFIRLLPFSELKKWPYKVSGGELKVILIQIYEKNGKWSKRERFVIIPPEFYHLKFSPGKEFVPREDGEPKFLN